MQRQMEEGQKDLETQEFSSSVGGGAVEVKVNGKKEVLAVKIDKEVVDPDDVEMLQDLVLAAVNDAINQAETASQALVSKMTGGMGVGSFGGPGGLPF